MRLKAAYETEAYVSDEGYYCIKQPNSYGDDSVVLLTRDQLADLVDDMQKTLHDDSAWQAPSCGDE